MSTIKNNTLSESLAAKGWSIRAAASLIGCHWSHLARVVCGERHSRSLTKKIIALPKKPKQP